MPKLHERNISPLLEARKKSSKQKLQTLKTVLEDMIHNKEEISIPRVCSLTGLSKSFLYQNEQAKSLFTEAKQQSARYDSSVKPQGYIPSGINTSDKFDLLLQYEETKRKLQDSYILQYQLLSAENERLRQEISKTEAKLATARSEYEEKITYRKASPKFKIHVVFMDIPENELVTYQLKTCTGKVLNPVGEKIINNITWGEHTFSSSKYSFELANPIDGVSLDCKDDNYILTISDTIKSSQIIKILIRINSKLF